MKTRFSIFLLIIVLIFCAYKSSSYRFSCHKVKGKMLGKIDFKTNIKSCNFENHKDAMTFVSYEDEIVFNWIRDEPHCMKTQRYTANVSCREIIQDKDPITVFDYYEYENLENSFVTEGGQLIIRPFIEHQGPGKLESLQINFGIHKIGYSYGKVPFYNDELNSVAYSNSTNWFKHHDYLKLNERLEFSDVWVYKQSFLKGELDIYYSKNKGLLALAVNKKVYVRKLN